MRYIGSKASTLGWLTERISTMAPEARSLCDPFAGTCVVPRHFKSRGMTVVTGDVLMVSHVLQRATLGFDTPPNFSALQGAGLVADEESGAATAVFAYLQNLPGRRGYYHDNYSDGAGGERRFFTASNAIAIDAIRTKIAEWQNGNLLTDDEEAFLLASLIEAADRVASTAGTYYAHLKNFPRRALLPLALRAPLTTTSGRSAGCFRADAATVVTNVKTDILYLDPPYNQRDYSGYYHLPETIARGDEPEPRGRAGVPIRANVKSDFYRRSHAQGALAKICAAARARHIVVHYTTDGIIPHEAIIEALAARGAVTYEDREVRAYSSRIGEGRGVARHRLYWCRVNNGAD